MTKGFLIDMDGVIYSNDELIKGAGNFIAALQERNIPFLFLTNNSQRTPRDAVNKLAEMGVKVLEENIYTSAIATGGSCPAQNRMVKPMFLAKVA